MNIKNELLILIGILESVNQSIAFNQKENAYYFIDEAINKVKAIKTNYTKQNK
jgi:hypothetical protein